MMISEQTPHGHDGRRCISPVGRLAQTSVPPGNPRRDSVLSLSTVC
jgi:hypothetical protein